MLNITTKKLAQQSDKSTLFNLGVDLCNDFKKAAKDLDVEFNECANNVEAAIQKVKKAMIDTGEDFKVAEGRSTYKFGPEAKSVFDLLASRANGHFKVARVENTGVVFYTKKVWEQEPYVSIKEATETLKREAFKVSLLNDIKYGLDVGVKIAGLTSGLQSFVSKKIHGEGEEKADIRSVDDIETAGLKPEYIHALNNLKAKTTLFSILHDDVLSKYPVEKIISEYNAESSLNPKVYLNPVTAIPALRQKLETPDRGFHDLKLERDLEESLERGESTKAPKAVEK